MPKNVLLCNVPQPGAMLSLPRMVPTAKGISNAVCLGPKVSNSEAARVAVEQALISFYVCN